LCLYYQLLGKLRLGGLGFKDNLGKKLDLISTNKLDVVVHFCNSSYQEGIGRRIGVSVQLWAKS
jgi:hypothetical protein